MAPFSNVLWILLFLCSHLFQHSHGHRIRLRHHSLAPSVTLSTTVKKKDDPELAAKIDALDEDVHDLLQKQQERRQFSPVPEEPLVSSASVQNALARHTITEMDEATRKHELQDAKELQEEAEEEGRERGSEAATLKVAQMTQDQTTDADHNNHVILDADMQRENKATEELEKEEANEEASQEERDLEDEEEAENRIRGPTVTENEKEMEDITGEAYNQAEATVKKADNFQKEILKDEEKSLLADNNGPLPVEEELEASEEGVSSAPQKASSTGGASALPHVTGVMDHPCPCIEEMMEQPCPPKKNAEGEEQPSCADMLDKVTAEERLQGAEESVKRTIRDTEHQGPPLIVKRTETTQMENEEEGAPEEESPDGEAAKEEGNYSQEEQALL